MLLSGERADAALAELLSTAPGVVALSADPSGLAEGKPRLFAIASTERSLLVDATSPAVLSRLAEQPLLGAADAKPLYKILRTSTGHAPARWACVHLSELLLAGGRPVETSVAASAARHGVSAPIDPEAGLEAMGAHALAIAQVIAAQIPALKAQQLGWVSKIEAAAVAPVGDMEIFGMAVDAPRWRQLNTDAERERQGLLAELLAIFSGPVGGATGGRAAGPSVVGKDLFGKATLNLDSDQALKEALHALGHPVPNVRRDTLAALPSPLGDKLSRYRELGKMVSTYGEAFLAHVRADGRVHPTFEQIGASTGRMACHAPNLQAMVKDAPYRSCFRAPAGRTLVIGDYATCELRILAEMSQDPVFLAAFARGDDLHAHVASSMFGKPVSKHENPELRQRAKAINFGLVYGMGAQGLARTLETSTPQAEELLRRYFATFPRIGQFLEETARTALRRGYASTMTGRRLNLEVGEERGERAQAGRIAKNMPIQGTSADITKIALARLRQAVAAVPGAQLVNAVHDELVLEGAIADGPRLRQIMIDEMTAAGKEVLKTVAVAVDAEVSPIWGK